MDDLKVLVTLTITNFVLPAQTEPTQDPDDLLTAEEAGKLLSLNPDTVRKKARIGELDSIKVGKRGRRYQRPALDRWVRAHRSQ